MSKTMPHVRSLTSADANKKETLANFWNDKKENETSDLRDTHYHRTRYGCVRPVCVTNPDADADIETDCNWVPAGSTCTRGKPIQVLD